MLVANVVAAVVPDIAVFGSVACEREIGGINPAAVEAALRGGAKIVSLPTVGVRGEARIGVPGNPAASAPPIAVCDDETGELLYHTHEVMALVAQHDAILATGHISQFESYAVAKAFAGKGRIIVTNATELLTADQCIELVALGATIEITAKTFIGNDATRAPTEAGAFIRAIGTDHVVLSSGLGSGADGATGSRAAPLRRSAGDEWRDRFGSAPNGVHEPGHAARVLAQASMPLGITMPTC